jgi:hypothetical protein
MNKENLIIEEIEDEDYEMWQYEHSAIIASDFINDVLLEQLDKFENDNDDDKYIYGIASHGLFISLITRLGEMGYTEKELRKEIKIWLNSSVGQVVH